MESENKTLGINIQKSFSVLLKDYLPKNLLDKTRANKPIKIISIACGKFIEAECLLDYFSPNEKQIKLYGIEIDEELLNDATNRLLKNNGRDHIFLKAGDASNLENYKDWIKDSLFDLIIVRHPEITFNTDVFMKIFSNFNNLLNKNGYLFITTHYEDEKRALSYLFKILKLNSLVDIENKNPVSLKKGEDLVFADRFLLISSQ